MSFIIVTRLILIVVVFIHVSSDSRSRNNSDPTPFCSKETKSWIPTSRFVKNSEVVVLVESTIESNNIVTRVIPAYRTWMRHFANAFVVIEDSFFTRFVMRHCKMFNYFNPNVTEVQCPHEPIYILSRHCGGTGGLNSQEGQSTEATTCCKIDEMINHLVGNRHILYAKVKYVLISDDDTLWRPDQTMTWLNRIEEAGVDYFPMIASSKFFLDTNEHIFGVDNCNEIVTNGFYQPTVLNKAAIERVKAGHLARGFEQVCQSFQKYQDVGFGIWAWMYQLYTVFMPIASHTLKTIGSLHSSDFSTHALKGGCAEESSWPYEWRYDQPRVIGAGIMNQSCPKGERDSLDMYEAWKYFQEYGKDVNHDAHNYPQWCHRNVTLYTAAANSSSMSNNSNSRSDGNFHSVNSGRRLVKRILDIGEIAQPGEIVELRLVPHLRQLPGYADTLHSRKHDISQLYHPFTLGDCNPRGKLNQGKDE